MSFCNWCTSCVIVKKGKVFLVVYLLSQESIATENSADCENCEPFRGDYCSLHVQLIDSDKEAS